MSLATVSDTTVRQQATTDLLSDAHQENPETKYKYRNNRPDHLVLCPTP